MKTLLEIANQYTESNKHSEHCVHYFDIYDKYFSPIRDKDITLLEIGIFRGGSLRMWKEYFTNSTVIGVDINLPLPVDQRIIDAGALAYHGDATNKELITHIIKEHGNLDIIIDDGSHYSREQIKSFQLFFPHLKNGGIYIIEDLFPSYWSSHREKDELSCIDFCKNLVDNLNYMAYKNKYWKNQTYNYSDEPLNYYEQWIENISFYKGIVFIIKSQQPHKKID